MSEADVFKKIGEHKNIAGMLNSGNPEDVELALIIIKENMSLKETIDIFGYLCNIRGYTEFGSDIFVQLDTIIKNKSKFI